MIQGNWEQIARKQAEAIRPIFSVISEKPFYKEYMVKFNRYGGFSLEQKQKSIRALHEVGEILGLSPLLEISTKSEDVLGQQLSAFNLKIDGIPIECRFQGAKVIFDLGGKIQHTEFYMEQQFIDSPRTIKKSEQYQDLLSSKLVYFCDRDWVQWELEPKSMFYDWLYFQGLLDLVQREYENNIDDFLSKICGYQGFTDIAFNPNRSFSCQARSLAIFIALNQQGETEIFSDKKKFKAFYQNKHYVKADDDARPQSKNKGKNNQVPLF